MWSLSLEWLLLALLCFWAVGAYGRLARLRSACVEQLGILDLEWIRWQAMLAQCAASPWPGEQPAALQHAQAALQQTSVQLAAALAQARHQPLRDTPMAALEHAHAALEVAWNAMVKIADETGDEAQQQWLQQWLAQWSEHQGRHRLQAQHFNAAVQRLNAAIAQIPARFLAWLFGFRSVRSLCIAQPLPQLQGKSA